MMDKYRLNPDDCILIVIDIQERLMQAMEHRDKVYKNHDILLTLCKVFQIPVIQSEQYPRGLGNTVAEIKSQLPEKYLQYYQDGFFCMYSGFTYHFGETGPKDGTNYRNGDTCLCASDHPGPAGTGLHGTCNKGCGLFQI